MRILLTLSGIRYVKPGLINGQAQAKPWVDQSLQLRDLQRQVARLENDLRRYQNPRRPDFR